ncbi:MAG: metal ABC transporter ATP-binding protein [Clostridiales bacterium]|nr:metal ABC transporter ATP-binding protein [Clostridiales bacterium]
MILEVKNVSFDYPDKNILKDVSFSVEKGDFLCILGSNGTGKSTLLKLILNILKLQKGEILIEGIPSRKYKAKGSLAYVSQKATGFNRDFPATVYEVVLSGLYPLRGFLSFPKKEDKEKADEALKQVGIYNLKNKLIGSLSGGQQQRVFIAKAIVSEPKIIFLDEPTVGIDVNAVDSICCLLGGLNLSGYTIIMVTHDLSSVLHHSNKVLLLSENEPCRIYKTEEFLKQNYSEHYHHNNHHREV